MASAAKPILNALSMATNSSCIVSLPSLFPTNSSRVSSSHPHLPIPSKPIKLNLSCYQSYSSSSSLVSLFSLKKKKDSNFGAVFSAVAAQQEEDNTMVLEEEGESGEQGFDFDAGDSEIEVENYLEDPSGESEGGFEGLAGGEAAEDEEGQFEEPPEDAKLFAGNLPYDLDSEKLAQLFEQAGVVEIAEVVN